MPGATGTRRKQLVLAACGSVWGTACLWSTLRGWSMSTEIAVTVVSVVLPLSFWLVDRLDRRNGASIGAYANLMLCFINGTVAVQSWHTRRWLGGVAFSALSIVFAIWWFQTEAGRANPDKPGGNRGVT